MRSWLASGRRPVSRETGDLGHQALPFPETSTDMAETIRARSSAEANSTTIFPLTTFPLRRPSSTLTLVSNASDSRSASSVSAGPPAGSLPTRR